MISDKPSRDETQTQGERLALNDQTISYTKTGGKEKNMGTDGIV